MPRQRRSPLVLAILAATVPALALVGLVSAGLTWNRVRTFHDHELCVMNPVRWRARCETAWNHGWGRDRELLLRAYRRQEMSLRTTPETYWKSGEPRTTQALWSSLESTMPREATLLGARTFRDGDVTSNRGRAVGVAEATENFAVACENGNLASCAEADATKAERTGAAVDAKARPAFEAACTSGYARGCTLEGLREFDALGLDWLELPKPGEPPRAGRSEEHAAATWLEQGCKLGDPEACDELASVGERIAVADAAASLRTKARANAERRCDEADPEACAFAGWMDFDRNGPDEIARTLRAFVRGCAGGHPSACFGWARLYERGRGVAAHPRRSRVLAQIARDAGHMHAAWWLEERGYRGFSRYKFPHERDFYTEIYSVLGPAMNDAALCAVQVDASGRVVPAASCMKAATSLAAPRGRRLFWREAVELFREDCRDQQDTAACSMQLALLNARPGAAQETREAIDAAATSLTGAARPR